MILSLVGVVFLQPLNKLYNLIEIIYNRSIICHTEAQNATACGASVITCGAQLQCNIRKAYGDSLVSKLPAIPILFSDLRSSRTFLPLRSAAAAVRVAIKSNNDLSVILRKGGYI